MLELISSVKPDIILLQEIKCTENEFPLLYEKKGYRSIITGQKGRHGVAILIKEGINYIPLKFKSSVLNEEARVCGIKLPENYELNLINVYTPNGNPMENKEKINFKLKWIDELTKVVQSLRNKYCNVIVAGDFNVLENSKDVKDFQNWKDDALGNIEVRRQFRKILKTGLSNIVRLFKKPGENFSFWDYQKACWDRNYGLLIDHFLTSPKILQLIENISFENRFRGMEKPSDHVPVYIELNI